ncbi:MAG: GAF domain-containing protein, partial [Oscillochloris sp.]|nr:GAF domain-containing protein [Oscillochloris sp.]
MLKVLILDDDQLFNRTLSRVLERDESLGCVVTTATDDSGACEAVCGADPPFDVFLIDQRLGAGRDGIDVLEELQQRSPSSQAIIFTEAGNEESGLRAYLAGAYRYLHKPFKHEELVLVLKSLWAMIQVQRERDWLRVHAEIAEASQRPLSVEEMGQVVVESAQRLGFERSRLWLLTPDGDALLGANQAGNYGLEHFKECRIGTDEVPYMTEALAKHEPYLFNSDAYGQSYLSQRYGHAGYEDATDGWVGLPLWSEDRSMGVLHLDNLVQPRQVRREEFSQLALFGKLAAAALERAQLYEQERRKSREVELLATIGRHISDRAAVVSNKELIVEIYHLVGQLIDVSSFFLALYNDRTDVIDLAVDYLNREFVKPHSFRYGTGLTSYVIKSSAPLLLTTEAEIRTFRREHHIRKKGPTARCWLGVPLTVEQRTFGVMVVQSITHEHVFTQYHKLLLGAIADQVAGAIQASWLREAERSNMGRLSVLQRVSEELLRRALLDEGQMWHIVLTAATAEYGLRFNRAMLFLLDPSGATLVGEHGIGHLDSREARWSWRSDIRQKVTLDTYLEQLNHYRLLSTPVDTIIRDLRIEIRNNGRIFTEVMRDHVWRSVPAEQAAMHMPQPFVEQLGSAEYAVLPIIAAERSIGLLVVDNAFNHVPLSTMPLSELERLLSQAALVHENLVQRRASLSLLEVSKQMLSRVAEQPLQKTLSQICEVARALTGASCVTILPLMAGAGSHQLSFEIAQIGSTGLQHLEQRLSLNLALLSTLREGNYIAIPDIRIAT